MARNYCYILGGILFLIIFVEHKSYALKLPAQEPQDHPGNKIRDDERWGLRVGPLPSIPMWNFLPSSSIQFRGGHGETSFPISESSYSTTSQGFPRFKNLGSLDSSLSSEEVTPHHHHHPNDLSRVLSSKARLLNPRVITNSKRNLGKFQSTSYSNSKPISSSATSTSTNSVVTTTTTGDSSTRIIKKADVVKRNRPYDVPLIECPRSEDGMDRFSCPTPDVVGRYKCVDDHVLCDGYIDCPNAEDEDRQACMFYKTTKAHLNVLADALLRWARGR